jgi:hypothetical protein
MRVRGQTCGCCARKGSAMYNRNTGFRFSPVIHKSCLFTAFTISGACLLAAEYSAGTHCGDIVFQVLQIWSHCGTSYQHWRTYYLWYYSYRCVVALYFINIVRQNTTILLYNLFIKYDYMFRSKWNIFRSSRAWLCLIQHMFLVCNGIPLLNGQYTLILYIFSFY